ncbi:glycoside hydrolase family 57 protein [Athalassotoga saccharophila]|uniref:glycoside hydrolase family 57 protein n=1 Tax=Athalassotoga saccharophila TaxID=1441386 RepID=UPI0018D84978|nr:1,4-alpha-glucan branching protein domain-containing protein [Athalassotoga saccharophila]BBJ27859.1 1,4-alpha-glucan branching enzyme [Athalassotoga saccharophila]
MKGKIILMLHAHLPYVNHPDHPYFLEENWLFEAITETYIPLLMAFERLRDENVPFGITVSVSPPLIEMMADRTLMDKYKRHLQSLIELAKKEVSLTKNEEPLKHKMALKYLEDFESYLSFFERYGNLINAFKESAKDGNVQLITCNATHGFLPLMKVNPRAVHAQIAIGVKAFEERFKMHPNGMWLAESGYYPGLDNELADQNLKFFFVDSHALWYADIPPHYDVYRPVMTPSGVFVFARDPESSEQIWSAQLGYPGDWNYREFYRDIGFDRPFDYVRPYIDPSGVRTNTGIKYHKITGNVSLGDKELYDPDVGIQIALRHAKDFAQKKALQIKRLKDQMGIDPVIVAPFDAELFGHWWYEGPKFLEFFLKESSGSEIFETSTPDRVINSIDEVQILTPAQSSWGANGYNETWINGSNDWIYPHLHEAESRMTELANEYYHTSDPLYIRALNMCARELLLAESSDWAFIMTTGTSVEYAVNRTNTHLSRFLEIYDAIKSHNIDERSIELYEWLDPIFPYVDYRVYA